MHIYIHHLLLAALPLLCMALLGAVTLAPNLTQASSAYRDLPFEDLMNALDIFEPAATPLFTLAKTGKQMDNMVLWWEVDKYLTPNGALGPGDGYALQTTEITDVTQTRRKMANGGQLFRRGFGSGWVAERVPRLPGSGKGILASAMTRFTINLKQDIEVAMGAFDQVYNTDQGGANGGTMAGIRKMVDPANAYATANAAVPGTPTDIHAAPAAACVTGALADVFNLSLIKTVLQALLVSTNMDREYWLVCNRGLRQAISGLVDPQALGNAAPNSTPAQQRIFTRDQDDETFKQRISFVETDFGSLRVKLDLLLGTSSTDVNSNPTAVRANRVFLAQPNYGYIIPAEKLEKNWGWAIDTDELGHDGSGVTRLIFTYLTMKVLNPMGFGFLACT